MPYLIRADWLDERGHEDEAHKLRTLGPVFVKEWKEGVPSFVESVEFQGHTGSYVYCVAFHPDGKTMASGSYGKAKLILWDTKSGEVVVSRSGHAGRVSSVDFSSDGNEMASAGEDGKIKIRSSTTGKVHTTLDQKDGMVRGMRFSPDGQLLASCSSKLLKLWDLETRKPKPPLVAHKSGVMSIDFSPNGDLLASAGFDRDVMLWDTKTQQVKLQLEGHEKFVTSVSFSPDGTMLASASFDGTVRLWDIETGKEKAPHGEDVIEVNCVRFSHDGRLLAFADKTGTITLRDTQRGSELASLRWHGMHVGRVAFSPDGSVLAAVGYTSHVKLWDLEAVLQKADARD